MDYAITKLIDYGGVGIVAIVSISVMVWLVKELQRNFDACNERVDRLLDTHTKFIESMSRDMDNVVEKIEKVLSAAETLVDEIKRDSWNKRG